MKSSIPYPQQLDELAAGLDAGWDEEPAETSPSQPPLSTPPAELDALDADWDVAALPAAAPAPSPAPARTAAQARPNQARPSQTRPSPNRAVSAPAVVGDAPLRASKQERREAERKRRAHEARQKASNKKERKAERQTEARKATEQLRASEQQALAERRARVLAPTPARKRPPATSEAAEAQNAKRAAKRERRASAPVGPRPVRSASESAPVKSQAVGVSERASNKFLIPVLIALAVVFALTLGFALSRSSH